MMFAVIVAIWTLGAMLRVGTIPMEDVYDPRISVGQAFLLILRTLIWPIELVHGIIEPAVSYLQLPPGDNP